MQQWSRAGKLGLGWKAGGGEKDGIRKLGWNVIVRESWGMRPLSPGSQRFTGIQGRLWTLLQR